MPRPRQVSDEQIDAAARSVFLEHGHSAPVSVVAAKLGVSHAALLQRAGSKDNLLLRALSPRTSKSPALSPGESPRRAPGLHEIVLRLREGPPDVGRTRRLAALLLELHTFLGEMLPGLIVLRARGLRAGPPAGSEAPTVLLRRVLAEWLGRTEVVTKKRAPAIAEALLGAIEARCFNAHVGGDAFVTGDHARFVEALVKGVVPELGHARPQSPPKRGKKP